MSGEDAPRTFEPALLRDEELLELVRRGAASVRTRLVPTAGSQDLRAQLHGVATLLDAVAIRLERGPVDASDADRLAAQLDAGDDEAALTTARRMAAANRERVADFDWDALSG